MSLTHVLLHHSSRTSLQFLQVANIVAGGIAEAAAQQSGDLMQDLKTGAWLRLRSLAVTTPYT